MRKIGWKDISFILGGVLVGASLFSGRPFGQVLLFWLSLGAARFIGFLEGQQSLRLVENPVNPEENPYER